MKTNTRLVTLTTIYESVSPVALGSIDAFEIFHIRHPMGDAITVASLIKEEVIVGFRVLCFTKIHWADYLAIVLNFGNTLYVPWPAPVAARKALCVLVFTQSIFGVSAY